jgi:acetolactate synthase-1/2/3 large subunit
MNGAESLIHTLIRAGIDTCFANPGTSEMHFVAALDRIPGLRAVLGLFEGVVSGAADGYARLRRKPAAALFHCGPGLANAIANLHNARRARTPLLAIIGDQATYHRPLDAPLTADTEGLARTVSVFTATARTPAEVGPLAARAIAASLTPPGGIASLILPADTAWDEGGIIADPAPLPQALPPAPTTIADIARLMRRESGVMLLLGGAVLFDERALARAHDIAAATGARLSAEQQNARVSRGRGRPPIPRIPYPLAQALAHFEGVRHLVLVGAREPVSFFAYPGKPNRLAPPSAMLHVLSRPEQDGAAALDALAEALAAPRAPLPEAEPYAPASGPLTPESAAATLFALLPEAAVVIDEAGSFGRGFFALSPRAAPHEWLQLTGGAIGEGLPMALGAALAAPGQRVVALQADGSAMYTLQALWTMARERLDITILLFANRRYAILQHELAQVNATPGPTAEGLMRLDSPELDWLALARGMGVEAERAASNEALARLLAASFARPGPFLIELEVP